jgi:hypothetical protein
MQLDSEGNSIVSVRLSGYLNTLGGLGDLLCLLLQADALSQL